MAILHELDTAQGRIRIQDSQDKRTRTYFHNACSHSEVNEDGVSTCPYIHLMYQVIRQADAKDVLMLGCGGGTLATMLYKDGCNVTAVDISPESFELAKRYFGMPDGIRCVLQDGLRFVHDAPAQRYDAVAIDVFDSNGIIPEAFRTEAFFQAVRRILKPSGVVVMNVIIAHDFDMLADRIAVNLEAAIPIAVLLDWDRDADRNIVIAAGTLSDEPVKTESCPDAIRKELGGLICRSIRSRAYKRDI